MILHYNEGQNCDEVSIINYNFSFLPKNKSLGRLASTGDTCLQGTFVYTGHLFTENTCLQGTLISCLQDKWLILKFLKCKVHGIKMSILIKSFFPASNFPSQFVLYELNYLITFP